jgi:hypothetical protein
MNLPSLLEFQYGIDGAILQQRLLRRGDMELYQIKVGLHPQQTLLHSSDDVGTGEHVRTDMATGYGGRSDQAVALLAG